MAETKENVWSAVDWCNDGYNTECVMRDNGDGTVTVIEFHSWKHDIDLPSCDIHNNGTSKQGR